MAASGIQSERLGVLPADHGLTGCPAISMGRDMTVCWHSMSCLCELCRAVDRHSIGITEGWGWCRVHEVRLGEHPYWQLAGCKPTYAGGYSGTDERVA